MVQLTSCDEHQMRPSGAGLGAIIEGADLRRINAADFEHIYRAWLNHLVLLFRGQNLSADDLITFSRRLGDLDIAPVQETGRRVVEGKPELYIVSNVIENGQPIGSLGSGEAVWHTDMSYLPNPPKASLLYALEVPPVGGDTSFINMYSVYEALPPALKHRIEGLRIKHDGTYNSGGYLRQGVTPSEDLRTTPDAYHPLVYTHPETGRRSLYLGRRRNAYIEDFALADSEVLLNELWSYTEDHAFTWRNTCCVGDLVLWDNRCTMHRRDAFDTDSRRVMHRTQIKGERQPAA
jgi:taurine dioxygenase